MNNGEEYIHYYIQSDKEVRYLENIEINEYNMDKIMEYWYNKNMQKVNEYKHLIILDLETKGLKQLSKRDDFVDNFEKKLMNLNDQETFQSAMTYEEDQKLILNTEKKIAFEDSMSQEKVEIAKSMLKDGVTIANISKYTGLTEEEINNLKEN